MARRAHAMIVHMGMRRNAEFTPKDEALLAANSPSLLLHENAHDRYSQYFLSHGPTLMSTLNFHTPRGY